MAEEGLPFAPNPDVVPRSLAALRLAELARDLGRHEEVHEALMDAYWRDGVDLGDAEALRALDLGLPRDRVDEVLATDEFAARVRASTAQAQSLGIGGIPAWVIDGRILIPGAQPREVFERAYAQLSLT